MAANLLLSGRGSRPGSEGPVFRSAPSAEAVTVELVRDLSPEAAAPVPRGVALLSCPAPSLVAAERLDVALIAPSGSVGFSAPRVRATEGRVRIVIDLESSPSGTWTLEVRRVDVSDRVLERVRCPFDLR